MGRGRKNILDKLIEGVDEYSPQGRHVTAEYMVYYEYSKPRSKFYRHLDELMSRLEDGDKWIPQMIRCSRLHTAFAVRDLLNHYEAEKVTIYILTEIE